MTDLERQIRELLEDEVRSAPVPREATKALRKTRRRQAGTIVAGVLTVTAVVAASIVGLRAVRTGDRSVPANQPTVKTTINGISITHPEGWVVVDPDDAGLNGPEPTPDLPRLVLAVSPIDPGDAWGCPGLSQGAAPTFLMTVQDEPLALTGPDAAPWPVELRPMDVDAAERGCYPGWVFLRAGWTESGRTFEARVGLSPDVSEADREALFTAFASMAFDPVANAPSSVVLATGTAGGEEWQLIASRDSGGLSLTLQGQGFGTGSGGYDPAANELQLTSQVFGEEESAERVVFAAVPADVVLIAGAGSAFTVYPEVLDVPDEIDPRLNAFVVTVDADTVVAFEGFNATDDLVVSGGLDTQGNPLESGLPEPDEVLFDGRTNDCWWSLTRQSEGTSIERVRLASPLGELLAEIVADVRPHAPAIQLASYTCPIGQGGTLVFGLLTDEVADVRWPSSPIDDYGVPECWPGDFPSGFCFFLLDGVGDAGQAIALDASGNEIGRASFP